MEKTIKFETGKTYYCLSPCDSNCTWVFSVEKVTTNLVAISGKFPGNAKKKRVKIYTDYNSGVTEQYCKPLGNYSLAPTLRAGNEYEG